MFTGWVKPLHWRKQLLARGVLSDIFARVGGPDVDRSIGGSAVPPARVNRVR